MQLLSELPLSAFSVSLSFYFYYFCFFLFIVILDYPILSENVLPLAYNASTTLHISSVSLKCCFSILFAFSISVFVTIFSKFKSYCLSWMLCIVVGVNFSWFSSNHILISLIYSFSASLALSCSSSVMLSTSLLLSLFTFPSLLFY